MWVQLHEEAVCSWMGLNRDASREEGGKWERVGGEEEEEGEGREGKMYFKVELVRCHLVQIFSLGRRRKRKERGRKDGQKKKSKIK